MAVKYLDNPVQYLLDSGLLFEINRWVLHPYGLAMAVEVPNDDEAESEKILKQARIRIWDCTDDPEGIAFADDTFREGAEKMAAYAAANKSRVDTRKEMLGFVIQEEVGVIQGEEDV